MEMVGANARKKVRRERSAALFPVAHMAFAPEMTVLGLSRARVLPPATGRQTPGFDHLKKLFFYSDSCSISLPFEFTLLRA